MWFKITTDNGGPYKDPIPNLLEKQKHLNYFFKIIQKKNLYFNFYISKRKYKNKTKKIFLIINKILYEPF
jgi:hypothetical protein